MFYIACGFGIFTAALASIFMLADVPAEAGRFADRVAQLEHSFAEGTTRKTDSADDYIYEVAEPAFPTVVRVAATAPGFSGAVVTPALPTLEANPELRRDLRREQDRIVQQVDADVRRALQ